MTLVLAAFVGVGVATQGGDVVDSGPRASASSASPRRRSPGSGLAVGGLVRASLAAPVAAGLVIATFLLDTLGEALDLPDAVLDLSLYRHLGQPMAGGLRPGRDRRAPPVLAVGGLLVGAWGLRRRDLDR